MFGPLIRKLEHGANLTAADRDRLMIRLARTHRVGPRRDLIGHGERPDDVHVVLSGFACRYKVLLDAAGGLSMVLTPGGPPERGMPENAIAYDGPIDVIGDPGRIARAIQDAVESTAVEPV